METRKEKVADTLTKIEALIARMRPIAARLSEPLDPHLLFSDVREFRRRMAERRRLDSKYLDLRDKCEKLLSKLR
jgi:hypothetical protein